LGGGKKKHPQNLLGELVFEPLSNEKRRIKRGREREQQILSLLKQSRGKEERCLGGL